MPGGFELASVLLKALTYAASLLAAGSLLYLAVFRESPASERQWLRRAAGLLVALAALLTAARIAMQSAYLAGGTLAGTLDTELLALVVEGPLGDSSLLRWAGLALLLLAVLAPRALFWSGPIGAGLVAASFALVGHTLGEPRWPMAAALWVHLMAVAYWIGALWPLWRLAARLPPAEAAPVAHRFGRIAAWVVGALVLAGVLLTALLLGDPVALVGTPYGQTLLAKLAAVLALLALAASNKLRLVPAMMRGEPGSGRRLCRSIVVEAALVAAILLVTASMTTLVSPAGHGGG